jgi:hypothetical protein
MEDLFDADFRLKSSGGSPRVVLEKIILGMCLGSQTGNQRSEFRSGA